MDKRKGLKKSRHQAALQSVTSLRSREQEERFHLFSAFTFDNARMESFFCNAQEGKDISDCHLQNDKRASKNHHLPLCVCILQPDKSLHRESDGSLSGKVPRMGGDQGGRLSRADSFRTPFRYAPLRSE